MACNGGMAAAEAGWGADGGTSGSGSGGSGINGQEHQYAYEQQQVDRQRRGDDGRSNGNEPATLCAEATTGTLSTPQGQPSTQCWWDTSGAAGMGVAATRTAVTMMPRAETAANYVFVPLPQSPSPARDRSPPSYSPS